MPTYDYACEACGHAWELEQRISEAPAKKCPKCGKAKARRLISGGGNFILKGSGWYSDLYHKPTTAKTSTESSSSSDASPAPAKSESTEAKPDVKPAKKTTATKD